jgi:CBS domain-containing protein
MWTVGQILAGKKTQDVCTISPDATVYDAVSVLARHDLGALLVTKEARLVGVMTERDYARKVILKGRSSKTTLVREIMSAHVLYVTPAATIEDCMALMTNKYIRHLPVLEAKRLIGVVSMGDVVKALLGEKDFIIDELVRYITDSPMVSLAQRRPADEALLAP